MRVCRNASASGLLLLAGLAVGLSNVDPSPAVFNNGALQQRRLQNHSFRRDVARRAERNMMNNNRKWLRDDRSAIDSRLLEKAVPLEEYEARLVASGGKPISDTLVKPETDVPEFMRIRTKTRRQRRRRKLEDGEEGGEDDDEEEGEEENEDDDGDDYYMDDDDMYDLSMYSLKYATCQKIQRFSEDAVVNGEYSSLVTDDVVVLRLCPYKQCSADSQWGCSKGYGEYVIGLKDYLKVMLHYQSEKKQNLCYFCQQCDADGYLSYAYGDDDDAAASDDEYNGRQRHRRRRAEDAGDDDQAAADDDFYGYDDDGNDDAAAAGDDAAAANDDGGDDGSSNVCYTYSNLCVDYENWCDFDDEEGGGNENDDAYLTHLEYIDYFDCVELDKGEDGFSYWVSPRCDPYSNEVSMGIFYDPYCTQYAGNDVNLNDVSGRNFQTSIFQDSTSGECIQCADNDEPPYYNVNSLMCNKVYYKSGKCNTYIAYNWGEDAYGNEDVVCSYIESIRDGAYDASGQVYMSDHQYNARQKAEVTKGQRIGLILTSLLCGCLALYSCFLHHEITNVLLRSLSHGGLLPSEKRRGSNRAPRGGSRSSRNRRRRGSQREEDNDDWDFQASGQYA